MSAQSSRDADVLSTEELGARIGVSPQTVRRMAEAGEIPGQKFGKNWRFSYSAVLQELRRPHPSTGGNVDGDDQEDTQTS